MAALRHTLQRDDRQVPAFLVEVHQELQSGARLAPDFCRRRGARRVAWPVWSWLESRPSAGGRNTPVAFIGRPAAQSCVRAAGVVPGVVAQRTVHPAVRHLEAVCLADVATALRVAEPSATVAALQ